MVFFMSFILCGKIPISFSMLDKHHLSVDKLNTSILTLKPQMVLCNRRGS